MLGFVLLSIGIGEFTDEAFLVSPLRPRFGDLRANGS